ncbi:MAG: hypothetical protein AB7G12_16715 [Thermoanaerobaculia bacterium]
MKRILFGWIALHATLGWAAGPLSATTPTRDREAEWRLLPPSPAPLASGDFSLIGTIPPRTYPQGEGYVLTPAVASCGAGLGAGGCGCLCSSAIFSDGFESGDLSAWSTP